MINPIYVCSLYGESAALYTQILGSAPCKLFTNPLMYLSSPFELPDLNVMTNLVGQMPPVVITAKPIVFRNVYNEITAMSTFVAALQVDTPNSWPLSVWRNKLLGMSGQVKFVPYMEIIPDAMQSRAVRSYANGIQNALAKYDLQFEIQAAYPDNPKHDYLFKAFNPLVAEQVGSTYGHL